MGLAIISGTVVLIALYLMLSSSNGGAAVSIISTIGQQYTNIIHTLMGK